MKKKSPKLEEKLLKGELALKVLEAIADGAMALIDVFVAVSSPETGFGSSLTKTLRKIDQLQERRESAVIETSEEEKKEIKRKLAVVIHRLKKDGFVKPRPTTYGWITAKGLEKIERLKLAVFLKKKTTPVSEDSIKIFSFDIPQDLKGCREWLRSYMKSLDYSIVQKSVMMGTAKIPEEFLERLRGLELLQYIQIFTVGQKGTLSDYLKTKKSSKIKNNSRKIKNKKNRRE